MVIRVCALVDALNGGVLDHVHVNADPHTHGSGDKKNVLLEEATPGSAGVFESKGFEELLCRCKAWRDPAAKLHRLLKVSVLTRIPCGAPPPTPLFPVYRPPPSIYLHLLTN